STIPEGALLDASSKSTNGVLDAELFDYDTPGSRESFIGICTVEGGVTNNGYGLATYYGNVTMNTTNFTTAGILWGGNAGEATQTRPKYPNIRLVVGTVLTSATNGVVHVQGTYNDRDTGSRSYHFSQANLGAGTYYVGGFYDAPAADTTLTQASLTQTYGNANVAYSAHAFIVAGGAGTVDTGTVGLRVNGTSIDDNGTRTTTDTETLTTNIAALATDQYLETVKKWIGQITFELYTTSGAPTTYTVDFNYGLCKYDDANNRDFTLTGMEIVGLAGASDTSFDMELLHHSTNGWTYSAAAFDPGDGVIANWTTDLGTENDLGNGLPFAWKRSNLSYYVDGGGEEGILFRVIPTGNNSVASMSLHLVAVSEEL
ncbi:MAG: hypothetical protein ACYSW8_31745, partial [Planctomycetota bacterium]